LINLIPYCSVKPDNEWRLPTTLLKLIKFPNGLIRLDITEDDVDVIAGEALAHGRLLAQSLTTVSKELLEGTVMESIKLW
jgi:hypothetical protein